MAQSQPNLLDIGGEDEQDLTEEEESNHSLSDMNGLRSALSNPNLLDEPEQSQVRMGERLCQHFFFLLLDVQI